MNYYHFDIILPEGITLPEGANPARFGWKFLRRGTERRSTGMSVGWVDRSRRGKLIISENGDSTTDNCWTIGEWQSVMGRIILCENGFHCSPSIHEARQYVAGEVLALVEYDSPLRRSARSEGPPKTAAAKMRIVRAWTLSEAAQDAFNFKDDWEGIKLTAKGVKEITPSS